MSRPDLSELRKQIIDKLVTVSIPVQEEERLSERPLRQPPSETLEPIAIIGLHCRFPGAADSDMFIDTLLGAQNHVKTTFAKRFPEHKLGERCGYLFGALEDITKFDNLLFRISPREAEAMDPHHRLMLESVWLAIEDAGYALASFAEPETGVFVAIYNQDFSHISRAASWDVQSQPYLGTGVAHCLLPNRISYIFDLRGPSEVVDTACSSGLVAIHRAAQAIRNGECSQALAGGVSLLLEPSRIVALDRMGVLSKEHSTRIFSDAPTGQALGEGVGTVILKRLCDANADGDHIYGVVHGSRVNHRGRQSGSLTLPDVGSQVSLIQGAFARTAIKRADISYVEAHGAGGNGDIPEMNALRQCYPHVNGVGSVKGNIGCSEAAGGMSQLVKVLMAFRRGMMPMTLNHDRGAGENSGYLAGCRVLTANAKISELKRDAATPLRVALHAYGIGGVNAHMIIEEPPPRELPIRTAVALPILLTARSSTSLSTLARQLQNYVSSDANFNLLDLAFTMAVGRTHHSLRVGWVARSREDVLDGIERLLAIEINSTTTSFMRSSFAQDPRGADKVLHAIDEWTKQKPVDWSLIVGRGARLRLPVSTLNAGDFPLPSEANANPDLLEEDQGSEIGCSPVDMEVVRWIKTQTKLDNVELDMFATLEEYGIDSIMRAALSEYVYRQFGVQIQASQIYGASTIQQLLDHIANREANPANLSTESERRISDSPAVAEVERNVGLIRSLTTRKKLFESDLAVLYSNLESVECRNLEKTLSQYNDKFHVKRDGNGNIWVFLNVGDSNTFDLTSLQGLLSLFEILHKDSDFSHSRLIYLSHFQKDFSLGGDRRYFVNQVQLGQSESIEQIATTYTRFLDVLSEMHFITVGVVYGNALGGGFELLMALDYQFVWPGTKVGLPEVRSGLIAGMGGISYVGSIIGPARALRWNIAGEIVLADEAVELGLLSHLSSAPFSDALTLNSQIPDLDAAISVKRQINLTKTPLLKKDVSEWTRQVIAGGFLSKAAVIRDDFLTICQS
ncbi:poliketide synthase (plasmid) [Candidatus Burkholderia crenata]|nr:poliketide synthase [Candidatus Burkholderia crenata]